MFNMEVYGMIDDTTGQVRNCYIDFPTIPTIWPTYPIYPYIPVTNQTYYVCDGCGSGTYSPVHCCVKGKFGYYCSIPCAHGRKEPKIDITWVFGKDQYNNGYTLLKD